MLGGRNYRIDIADLGQDDPGTATKALHARARANQPYSVTKRNLTRELGGDPDYADEILQTYRYVAPAPRHPRRKRNDVDDCIRRLQTEGFDVTYYGPEGKEESRDEEKPVEPDEPPLDLGLDFEPPADVHEGRPRSPARPPRRSKRLKSRARQRYPTASVPGTHRGSNEAFQRLQTGRRSFGYGFSKKRPKLRGGIDLATGISAAALAGQYLYNAYFNPGQTKVAKAIGAIGPTLAAVGPTLYNLMTSQDAAHKRDLAAQEAALRQKDRDLEEKEFEHARELANKQEAREAKLFDKQMEYANTVGNYGPANLLPAWNRYTSDNWIARAYRGPHRRVQYYSPYAPQAPVYSRRRRRRAFDGYLERAPPRRRRYNGRRRGDPRFGNPGF